MAAENPPRIEATKVRRTGLAVVHEGEWVVAAAGSEADLDANAGPDQTVINYYFPVEIEVVATAQPIDHEALVDVTLGRLAEYLEGLA